MTIDLTPVRDLLRLDGADISVVSESSDSVHLQLLLESADCADCVMPKPMLEDVASKLLGVPVSIDDPRAS